MMMNHANFWSKTLIRNVIFSRFYYTNRVKKATLYSRISPLGSPKASVTPELDGWLRNGNKIRVAELQRIIRDLRKRKRFTQALQVSEWMNKEGVCSFTPTEHAVQLDLIGRVHGFSSAESYFNGLKDEEKIEKTYGALLNCYVRQLQTDKALAHMKRMKELGFASTALTYNGIMCLYTNIGQHEKVAGVLSEMKKNGVAPDNFSYRICINSHGVRTELDAMQSVLHEMESDPNITITTDWNTYAVVANFYIKAGLENKAVDFLKKSEARLENNDGTGYNHLISLYATLGHKSEVLRLWSLEKSACKKHINRDFITMLQSLVKLDGFEEAEKVLKEWESSGNCYDFRIPNIIISGYTQKGLYEKAETMLENLAKRVKATSPNSWGTVATGYFDKGEKKKAMECMKTALSRHKESKGWKPNGRVITGILNLIGDECSGEDAETFVAFLRTTVPVNKEMYHTIIRAYRRDGRKVDGVLERMKADKMDAAHEMKRTLES